MSEVLSAPPGLAVLPPRADYGSLTGTVANPLLERRAGRGWWLFFVATVAGTLLMLVAITWLLAAGIGIWGVNSDVVWGFAIANYVWWIGIGNAGTLISSMLLLTRQRWRASINRFAEAMTLFAATIAGLFPILHLGRPWYFYWLAPYPNIMALWPQWRSPLVWDFFAIATYILFSFLFWYTGLIPDLATLRDRAQNRFTARVYGALSLGWRGAARHWQRLDAFYWTMAALAVPLVTSVHSVVGLDFAAGIMPGWHETIFPPYFVVGAMFSGFAMVVTLAIPIRHALKLHAVVTLKHFDAMGRIMLMGALIMAMSYATEWFMAWYSGDEAERFMVAFQFGGAHAELYWAMLFFNCGLPQIFWLPWARRNLVVMFAVTALINVGMYLERILIVLDSLEQAQLPSSWGFFVPTFWDWAMLAGTFGFFCFLFACFVRLLPAVSMHEVRRLAFEEGTA